MSDKLYPLVFEPLLQPTIWGGQIIASYKGIIPTKGLNIGESWEICDFQAGTTLVATGIHQGKGLRQLINQFGSRLLGKANYERYGENFPLLVKFIDSAKDLSIQVHPDDNMANVMEGKPYGKNEMWYIVHKEEGAKLINGFSRSIMLEDYQELVTSGQLMQYLNSYNTEVGDFYFIPAGRIHAIGAGNLIIEIQQACDITYRVYDYDRCDDNGLQRELHLEQASQALCFEAEEECRGHDLKQRNRRVLLVHTPFFTTNVFHLTQSFHLDEKSLDSFRILVGFLGSAEVHTSGGNVLLRQGQSIFLPAELSELYVVPHTEECSFLETYID